MTTIQIPNQWRPRPHQMALWRYMENGGKRAVPVWHRRAGKDSTCLNWTASAAHQRRGTYWHMFPEARQGRKALWEAIDRDGRRMIDQAFPLAIRDGENATEMSIRLKCGSFWQIVGSDNYNSLMGANPVGVVFSEWSLARPSAWDYIRPILAENGGWAIFPYTPRGRNHGKDLFDMAQAAPGWFCEKLTVNDTFKIVDGKTVPLVGQEIIEEERASGMPDDMIEQEYYCSFDAANVGAYYGSLLNEIEAKGQISAFGPIVGVPVQTAWDLGYSDDTAIWFYQVHQGRVRFIDFYVNNGQGVDHYCDVLHRKAQERGWTYGDHWVPHDAKPKTMASQGKSIVEQAFAHGIRMRLTPNLGVQDGIQAARMLLNVSEFDRTACKDGLEALWQYQREWDEGRKTFRDHPLHDWTSHPADAFRYAAVAWRQHIDPAKPKTWDGHIKSIQETTIGELVAAHDRLNRGTSRRRI